MTPLATAVRPPRTAPVRRHSARARIRVAPLVPAAVVVLAAIVGPMLTPYDPTRVSGEASTPPSLAHPFGTDSVGLDVLSRTLSAARYDLTIALSATVLCTLAGILFGLVIGMLEASRGWQGHAARGTSRLFDLVQAVPAILIGLVVVSFFGASIPSLSIGMAVILAPVQMRLVRIEVLRVRKEAYLDAARMAGQSETALVLRHVLPNSIGVALENASYLFATSMLLTAALGFVGVGLQPPTPEWGAMLSSGTNDALSGRWWPSAFPALALMITVWAVATASHAFLGRPSR